MSGERATKEREGTERVKLARTVQLRDAEPLIKIEQLLEELIGRTNAEGGFIALCAEEDFPIAVSGKTDAPAILTKAKESKLFNGNIIKHEKTLCCPFEKSEFVVGYVSLNLNGQYDKKFETIVKLYARLISKELELADITASLQYKNEKIGRKQRQLEQAIAFKNNILSLTTHDIKSPLNAVQGYLELFNKYLADEGLDTGELCEYYNKINTGVANIADLIEQLNEIALLELQRIDLNLVKVDLNWIAQEVCDVMQGPALSKKQRLNLHLNSKPIYVEVDIPKLKRVIFNLITNAIKYTKTNGTIDVRLKKNKGMAIIEIEDNGIGIPPEKMQAIFEPFKKARERGTQGEVSTGLGLFTSNYFTRLFKGSISVESELKKGSKFIVNLPLAEISFS